MSFFSTKDFVPTPYLDIEEFRYECVARGAAIWPRSKVKVEEFDFGCMRGVAVQIPTGQRTAVRGLAMDNHHPWRWWRPWRRAWVRKAMTPEDAIGALSGWVGTRG